MAGDSLFSFAEHLLFDNEEDRLTAMEYYEDANGGEYNLNKADEDCLLDDCPSSTFPPKLSECQPVDMSTQPDISVDKARADVFKQDKNEYKMIRNMIR